MSETRYRIYKDSMGGSGWHGENVYKYLNTAKLELPSLMVSS